MSRIDEALRRSSAGAPDDDAAAQGVHLPIEQPIESYPAEGAAPHLAGKPEFPRAGIISAPRTGRRTGPFGRDYDGKMATTGMSPASHEQYRRLAATLHDLQVERGVRTLMVSSAVPREGKSLNAANLALTLSESYKRRVLLIDADLRRPTVHAIFQLPNTSGLRDALRSERAQPALVEVSPTLTVLAAGAPVPDPMAVLASPRLKMVLDEAAARFDWVLVDTPPVGLLPDASLVARLVDGVLLVVAAGQTDYRLVQRAIAELGAERIIGTILNRAEQETIRGNEYYAHYYVENGA